MKNFKLIKSNIDVKPFLSELENYLKENNWQYDRARRVKSDVNTVHISLRDNLVPNSSGMNEKEFFEELINTDYNMLNTRNYKYFINTYKFLEDFADSLESQLSMAIIVKLPPKMEVLKHYDRGDYYKKRDRYHLPIKTAGSVNICEEESQTYNTGELWWFNNKKWHEAHNISETEDRIHIIFDILPKKRTFAKKFSDFIQKKISTSM